MRIGFLSALFLITYSVAIWYIGQEIVNERHYNLAKADILRIVP